MISAVVRRVSDSPFPTYIDPDDRRLFSLFRLVFAAERCRERRVYWLEERRGRTVLRQVLGPRALKQDDKLIGILSGACDIDRAKLAIASSSARRILTGVRWELYGDFACTEQLAMGRYDVRALFPEDGDRAVALLAQNDLLCSTSPLDWDFDGFLTTHHCPTCLGGFTTDVAVFVPSLMVCKQCGRSFDKQVDFLTVLQQVVQRLPSHDDGVHLAVADTEVGDMAFIDVHATAAFCWIASRALGGWPMQFAMHTQTALANRFSLDAVLHCFRRSIFPLLEIPMCRERFIALVHGCYARHEAASRARPTSDALLAPDMPDEVREYLRYYGANTYVERRAEFDREMEALRGLRDWFFGTSAEDTVRRGRQTADEIARVLTMFAYTMNELIEDAGERILAQEGEGSHGS